MDNLGSVNYRFTADASQLEVELRRVERTVDGFAGAMQVASQKSVNGLVEIQKETVRTRAGLEGLFGAMQKAAAGPAGGRSLPIAWGDAWGTASKQVAAGAAKVAVEVDKLRASIGALAPALNAAGLGELAFTLDALAPQLVRFGVTVGSVTNALQLLGAAGVIVVQFWRSYTAIMKESEKAIQAQEEALKKQHQTMRDYAATLSKVKPENVQPLIGLTEQELTAARERLVKHQNDLARAQKAQRSDFAKALGIGFDDEFFEKEEKRLKAHIEAESEIIRRGQEAIADAKSRFAEAQLKAETDIARTASTTLQQRLEAEGKTVAAIQESARERIRIVQEETAKGVELRQKLFKDSVELEDRLTEFRKVQADKIIAIEIDTGEKIRKIREGLADAAMKAGTGRAEAEVSTGRATQTEVIQRKLTQELIDIERRRQEAIRKIDEDLVTDAKTNALRRLGVEKTALDESVAAETKAADQKRGVINNLVASLQPILAGLGKQFEDVVEKLKIEEGVAKAKVQIDLLNQGFKEGVIQGTVFKDAVKAIQDNLRTMGATAEQANKALSAGVKESLGQVVDFRDTLVEVDGVFKQGGEGIGRWLGTVDKAETALQEAGQEAQEAADKLTELDKAADEQQLRGFFQEIEKGGGFMDKFQQRTDLSAMALFRLKDRAEVATPSISALAAELERAAAASDRLDRVLVKESLVPSLSELSEVTATSAQEMASFAGEIDRGTNQVEAMDREAKQINATFSTLAFQMGKVASRAGEVGGGFSKMTSHAKPAAKAAKEVGDATEKAVPSIGRMNSSMDELGERESELSIETEGLYNQMAIMDRIIQSLTEHVGTELVEAVGTATEAMGKLGEANSKLTSGFRGAGNPSVSMSLSLETLLDPAFDDINAVNFIKVNKQGAINAILDGMRRAKEAQKRVDDFLRSTGINDEPRTAGTSGLPRTASTGSGDETSPIQVGGRIGTLRMRSFDAGGVVPGPVGRPQLAVVHGGEEVLRPEERRERGAGGMSISMPVNIRVEGVVTDEVLQQMDQKFADAVKRNASAFVNEIQRKRK